MEHTGQLTATQAKQVLSLMLETGRHPEQVAADQGFEAMDSDELESQVAQIIEDNAESWQAFVDADEKKAKKLTGFFIGKVMQATKGQADGKVATRLLNERRARG